MELVHQPYEPADDHHAGVESKLNRISKDKGLGDGLSAVRQIEEALCDGQ